MLIVVDPHSGVPVYRQLMDQVKFHVASGLLKPGDELPSTRYRDARGRPKRVRYWRLRPVGGELAFLHEVTGARWVTPAEAEALLTYERDRAVLGALRGGQVSD